jgi:DNA-binding beta-propeller fold protein YncE
LLLLSLSDGSVRGRSQLGSDPIAVGIAPDGAAAYVSDNAAGKVYALSLPQLKVRWTAAVGGRPGPVLAQGAAVWVSLYQAGQVAELDPASGGTISRRPASSGSGQLALQQGDLYAAGTAGVWRVGGERRSTVSGFGLASAGGALWAADYGAGTVVRLSDGKTVQLPAGLHPFWLSPGSNGSLLVAAEGADEDADPGAVLRLEAPDYDVRMLLAATDPDQVVEAGGRVYVASHGSRRVDVLGSAGERIATWATGAAPVALAVDEPLRSLLVVTDERE